MKNRSVILGNMGLKHAKKTVSFKKTEPYYKLPIFSIFPSYFEIEMTNLSFEVEVTIKKNFNIMP